MLKSDMKKTHTVRCTAGDQAAVDRLAVQYQKSRGVRITRGEAYILAVRDALSGKGVTLSPSGRSRLDRLLAFFRGSDAATDETRALDRALQIACQSLGLEQRTDVEPIGGE